MDDNKTAEQVETGEGMTIDALEDAVNSIVDSDSASVDNNTQAQHNDAEKALNDMRERMGAIEADNKRLAALVGKMVSQYGARLSEETPANNNEAFPSSIEKQFDAPKTQVPSLGDIVLGN